MPVIWPLELTWIDLRKSKSTCRPTGCAMVTISGEARVMLMGDEGGLRLNSGRSARSRIAHSDSRWSQARARFGRWCRCRRDIVHVQQRLQPVETREVNRGRATDQRDALSAGIDGVDAVDLYGKELTLAKGASVPTTKDGPLRHRRQPCWQRIRRSPLASNEAAARGEERAKTAVTPGRQS